MASATASERRFPRIRLQTLLLSLIAAGIVHVLMTLAWPHWISASPVRRIAAALPGDGMYLLPPTTPRTQLVPFQTADMRYAACKFTVTDGAYAVRASLPAAGWTFSVHGANGETVYVVTGQDQRRTDVATLILPPGDRFIGVLPESRLASGFAQVTMPTADGIAIIRAPDRGAAYQAEIEAELTKASCVPRRN